MIITSQQNPKIKYAAKLQMKKYRDKEQKILVEGYYPIKLALNNDYPIDELLLCPGLLRDKFNNKDLVQQLKRRGVIITEISESVYTKISSYTSPEGLLAIAPQKHTYLKQHNPKENCLYIVAESIENLSSLGNLFRLVDNAGASGIVLCDMRADMYNPQVIRSSMGTFFSISILQSTTGEAILWFQRNRISVIATSPGAVTNYTQVDMTGSLAIALGTEHAGLSTNWLEKADVKVKIPMYGQADSLSVSATAAVMLYEAVRQRRSD